jgi:hypothetical protein
MSSLWRDLLSLHSLVVDSRQMLRWADSPPTPVSPQPEKRRAACGTHLPVILQKRTDAKGHQQRR